MDSLEAETVEPKLAVSVIPVREDATAGLQVFVQHRVTTMDFAAGVLVFPGGRVDPMDHDTAAASTLPAELLEAHARAWARSSIAGQGAEAARTMSAVLVQTALREVMEEAGLALTTGELVPWANWVTPPGRRKRFDTYFFIAHIANDRVTRHLTTEAHRSEWLAVREVLRLHAVGEVKLMRPTLALLTELADLGDVAAALSAPRAIEPVRPARPGAH